MKLFLFIYDLLWYLACPFIAISLFIKARKLPAYRQRVGERFGFFQSHQPVDIWCHAVSVGEVVAASSIIEQSLAQGWRVLVTTMTPTGSEQVKRMWGDKVFHQYCPYDFSYAIKRFLKDRKPRLLVVFETELWPGLLSTCHQKQIPILLANARISNRSYKTYLKTAWFWRSILQFFQKIYVQSSQDMTRFLSIGASSNQLELAGNLKFQASAIDEQKLNFWEHFKSFYPERAIWVVGSTHQGEEEKILEVWKKLHPKFPHLMLMLVPRHPERFNRVFQLLKQNHFKHVQRLTTWTPDESADIVLVDQMGVLTSLYSIASFAFVGGSLVPIGGHNVLEPLSFGVPVITGPHTHNQQDLVRLLQQDDAIMITPTAQELTQVISMLLSHQDNQTFKQKSLDVMQKHQGSLDKHMQGIIKALEC